MGYVFMRIIDILNSKCCKKLFLEGQNFVKLSLSDYNNSLENGDFDYSSKDIFDFVWELLDSQSPKYVYWILLYCRGCEKYII